jgi:NADH pyrophosphatase NudC (nudix superfamily)
MNDWVSDLLDEMSPEEKEQMFAEISEESKASAKYLEAHKYDKLCPECLHPMANHYTKHKKQYCTKCDCERKVKR